MLSYGGVCEHTESTKNRVCKAITDRQLPLCRDHQTKRRDEEEIGNKGIRNSNASPFHKTQRERRQGCAECAKG